MRLGRRNTCIGIPRSSLEARHVTQTTDSRGRQGARSYITFEALSCTVQPYVGKDLSLEDDGFNQRDIRQVYTATACNPSIEGTDTLADELLIDSKWFKVIKSRPWQVGVQSHYELTVVEIDEVLNG